MLFIYIKLLEQTKEIESEIILNYIKNDYFARTVHLKQFLLLFNYSCMPFLHMPPPHQEQYIFKKDV